MKLLHDNEPVVKVASAASKETQRERSFLEHRYSLSVRRANGARMVGKGLSFQRLATITRLFDSLANTSDDRNGE